MLGFCWLLTIFGACKHLYLTMSFPFLPRLDTVQDTGFLGPELRLLGANDPCMIIIMVHCCFAVSFSFSFASVSFNLMSSMSINLPKSHVNSTSPVSVTPVSVNKANIVRHVLKGLNCNFEKSWANFFQVLPFQAAPEKTISCSRQEFSWFLSLDV